jgi:hypothetical protein
MTVADKVARHVSRLLKEFDRIEEYKWKNEAFLYPYLNGREKGYAIWVEHDLPVFIFAENRRSDDIVVYEDSRWWVANNLGDEAYENKKLFGYQKEEQAARYIVRRIKKLVREHDRHKRAVEKAEEKAHAAMVKRHKARRAKEAKRKKRA